MTKNQKINLFVSAAILFLLLQWFLVTQKPVLLGLAILAGIFLFFRLVIRDTLFSVLPILWTAIGLAVLYFLPNQIVLLAALAAYLAGSFLALKKRYDWWQALGIFTVFFVASFLWFFSLAQAIDFVSGLVGLAAAAALILGQSLFVARRKGELTGIKNKSQILILAGGSALGFAEIIWALSFLPFSYFISGAIFTTIWVMVFNIFRRYGDNAGGEKFREVILRSLLIGSAFIFILIVISPWLPQR